MFAWVVEEFGNHEDKLVWKEVDRPEPFEGSALVRVKAVGVNFFDILAIDGKYQVKPDLPFIPGFEVMGEVIETGPGSSFRKGDRIMSMIDFGGFAEYAVCPDGTSFAVPDRMPDLEAGAFLVNYQTAYFGLVHRGMIKAGEFLLVHGGAGGVGNAAIQIGKAMGAKVIATAGSPEKIKICEKSGADYLINYTTDDFVPRVKEITEGRGVDLIYDPVGGDVYDKSLKCISWEGRIVLVGFAGGRIQAIAAISVLLKNYSVVGLHWGPYRTLNPEKVSECQKTLYQLYSNGHIKPILYGNYRLRDLPEALGDMQARRSFGKIALQAG